MEQRRHKGLLRRTVERLVTRALTTSLARLVRAMPLAWCRRLGNLFGYGLYVATWRRQRLADRNLVETFGDQLTPRDRRRIRVRVTQNMCKLFVELFKLSTFSAERVREFVPMEGADVIRRGLERGRGVLIVTAHFGNWEVLGGRLVAEGFPLTVIARDSSDTVVTALINDSRNALGMSVLGKRDVKGMMAQLRRNRLLGILPDQHSRKGAVKIDFLGRPAWCVRSPALLALRTGCAIVPTFCVREPDDSLRAIVLEEIEASDLADQPDGDVELTKRINAAIEQQIRAHPDQWLWLHDRWKPYASPEQEEKWARKEASDEE